MLGWTDPAGSRSGLGALLVGYHENGELRFGGKVGTGFNERELADAHRPSSLPSSRRIRRSPTRRACR